MKEYKIYYDGTGNTSINFMKFAKEIENQINSDHEIIERAKAANNDLHNKIIEIIFETDHIYTGAIIQKILDQAPRYRYIKHLEYNGKEYEAEIDLLRREFTLIEI